MKLSTFTCALLLAMAGSLLLSGCRSSSITVLGASEYNAIPLEGNPFEMQGDPSVIRLNDDEFVMTRMASKTELRVEKYSRMPAMIWSTPIILPEPTTSFKFMLLGFGFEENPVEVPIKFFRKGGEQLVMISHRYGDDDTLFAVGRIFDLATGKQILAKTLDTITDQGRIDDPYKRYFAAISPDTSRIVLYGFGNDVRKNNFHFRIASMPADLSTVTARTVDVAGPADINSLNSMRIDPAGNIFLVSMRRPDTVRVSKFDMASGTIGAPVTTTITDGKNDDAEIGRLTTRFNDREDLMMMASIRDDEDLIGASIVKFDALQNRFAYVKPMTLTEPRLEQLFDDDDYEDATFHTSIMTGHPKAAYIMAFEQQQMKEGKRVWYYRTGDVLLMAFDANGEPTWQQSLKKSMGWIDIPTELITMDADITRKGTVKVLYRENANLISREYRLDDGTEVTTSNKTLLEMGAAALHLGYFTTWLDDQTVILLTRQGVFSKDWSLARLKVR